MRNVYRLLIVSLILTILLAGCNGRNVARNRAGSQNAAISQDPAPAQNSAAEMPDGQRLYNEQGCLGCHAVTRGVDYAAGPSMLGLAERAEAILADPNYTGRAETVEGYIKETILEPNIYINEGYDPTMPAIYDTILTAQQVEAIVDYIMTLQ